MVHYAFHTIPPTTGQSVSSRQRFSLLPRRRRELHHLGDRARVDSKPSRRRAMAQPLDPNRVANPPIKLHALHPPPSANSNAKSCVLPDFCSGATGKSGRFNEGLLLRRSHLEQPKKDAGNQNALVGTRSRRLHLTTIRALPRSMFPLSAGRRRFLRAPSPRYGRSIGRLDAYCER